ncbi:hypothetical protein [Ulvibacter antarcticus]|uniref:Uncharacterized protein n=1 Tax=Ulvibacter antarcticus TaxID=442714 RepID=A0A3L9YV83_9FLAO|nr:hypothetical protein [Ulvibacter antarcticus]RMA64651.1 hypothetical protein BXY75_1530 [Ulvibacter antarcticus]
MKYKTTGLKAGHKIFIRKRESAFDNGLRLKDSTFGTFEDHKEMKTYEYAAFQKKVFEENRILKRKRNILIIITIIAVVLILLSLPFLYDELFSGDYQKVKF